MAALRIAFGFGLAHGAGAIVSRTDVDSKHYQTAAAPTDDHKFAEVQKHAHGMQEWCNGPKWGSVAWEYCFKEGSVPFKEMPYYNRSHAVNLCKADDDCTMIWTKDCKPEKWMLCYKKAPSVWNVTETGDRNSCIVTRGCIPKTNDYGYSGQEGVQAS